MRSSSLTTLLLLLALGLMPACSLRSYVVAPLGLTRVDSVSHRQAAKTAERERDFMAARDADAELEKEQLPEEEEQIDPDNLPLDDLSAAELPNSFIGNETVHIKFSRYDPFGSGSSFEIDLDKVDYAYPIEGKFSSGYGPRGRSMHSGVDLIAPAQTPIYAVFDGVVRLAKPYSGYGNVIVIRHANGLETVYSHNSKNLVRVGQEVKMGEQIALCGRTGSATTNHLHFEVRVQGITINPTLLLDVQQKKLQSGTLRVSRSSKGSISAMKVKPEDDKLLAKADQANDDVIMQKEPPKANASRGVRVDGQLYEVPTESAKSTESKSSSSGSKAVYHTIAKGQTLSGVAQKYSTTVKKICALNNIPYDKADKVAAGRKIRVK